MKIIIAILLLASHDIHHRNAKISQPEMQRAISDVRRQDRQTQKELHSVNLLLAKAHTQHSKLSTQN